MQSYSLNIHTLVLMHTSLSAVKSSGMISAKFVYGQLFFEPLYRLISSSDNTLTNITLFCNLLRHSDINQRALQAAVGHFSTHTQMHPHTDRHRFQSAFLLHCSMHNEKAPSCLSFGNKINYTRKPSWRWQTRATRKHAENCSKIDVKTSFRQVNDLFEVMQQPSAPSGKWWYWRILLEK